MPKRVANKKYTPEFKKLVVETMLKGKLGYSEAGGPQRMIGLLKSTNSSTPKVRIRDTGGSTTICAMTAASMSTTTGASHLPGQRYPLYREI